jgi:hypothetical protein
MARERHVKIEAYDFGRITIDGKTYTRDLKIVAGKVVPDWWRREGHRLLTADIEDIVASSPEVLVLGTGYSGLMKVSADVRTILSEKRIELIAEPTAEACEAFNRAAVARDTAFAAHLTC